MSVNPNRTHIAPLVYRVIGLSGVVLLLVVAYVVMGTSRNGWIISGLLMLFMSQVLLACWPLLMGSRKPVYGPSFIAGWCFAGIGTLLTLTGIAYQ